MGYLHLGVLGECDALGVFDSSFSEVLDDVVSVLGLVDEVGLDSGPAVVEGLGARTN